MPDGDNTTTGASKRRQKHHRVLPVKSDEVVYRLLCPTSSCGAVIGRNGTVVKLMEQATGSTITMGSSIRGCSERIISVVGPKTRNKTIILKTSNHFDYESSQEEEEKEEEEEEEEGEEMEVSPAQHGLIRVIERVLESGNEIEELFPTPGLGKGLFTCRLLTDGSTIGFLMGRSGKKIKKIEDDCGAKILISSDRCPPCASPSDQLIQITGGSLALKKAVLAVSRCLREPGPLDRAQMTGSKTVVQAPNRDLEFLSHQTFFTPPGVSSSVDYASRGYFPPTEEVVFRLILTDDRIGGVIGKGGTIVKAMQDQTGASIRVGPSLAESTDRVVHISAMEDMGSQYSPAQDAVVSVFTRYIDVGNEKRLESGENQEWTVEARLLVHAKRIGCLLGKGGTIMSDMRRVTRVDMWVLNGDQLPPCAAEDDRLLRVRGGFNNVKHALVIATGKLRDSFFPNKMVNTAERMRHWSGMYQSVDKAGQAALTASMHRLGLSRPSGHSLSPETWRSRVTSRKNRKGANKSGRESTSVRDDSEHGSGSKPAVLTNTTLEILVPEDILPFIYGVNESNLNRLREISGAKVEVNEPPYPGTSEAVVIISGTPDQAQAAQSVLHAYLLNSGGLVT